MESSTDQEGGHRDAARCIVDRLRSAVRNICLCLDLDKSGERPCHTASLPTLLVYAKYSFLRP